MRQWLTIQDLRVRKDFRRKMTGPYFRKLGFGTRQSKRNVVAELTAWREVLWSWTGVAVSQ